MSNEQPESNPNGRPSATERGGLWGVFFSAAGLLLPPFGIVLSLFGIFQGRRARRSGRERNVPAPGAVFSMVLGWIGVTFSAFAIAGWAVFYDEYTAYQACTQRAHTVSSQEQCDESFRQAVAERAGLPEEQVPALDGVV
ncbi:hypothetical protein FHX37_2946 [Haloactinospora alba]|uniref:DUF4190 domain-containing protein n=1 Tax=Haloactinospora alba TaxID=405555 RepID=A0A543NMC4_9ACTN|nr:DUF4190 domain-containing protein [Haloactinospora alba]TQN32957.1 hypothetical protein FHX37_2946 [Haloactinospora alba]